MRPDRCRRYVLYIVYLVRDRLPLVCRKAGHLHVRSCSPMSPCDILGSHLGGVTERVGGPEQNASGSSNPSCLHRRARRGEKRDSSRVGIEGSFIPSKMYVSIDEELAQAFRLRSSTQVAACFCILLTFGTPPHMLLRPNRQNGLDLVPGIGDAGDRLYLGTNATDKALPLDDDEGPSKKPKNSAT